MNKSQRKKSSFSILVWIGSVVSIISRWFWKQIYKLIGGVFVLICVTLAIFFYLPVWNLESFEPNENLPAFADDWSIKEGFRAWSTAKELALLSWIAYGDGENVKRNCEDSYELLEEIKPVYSDQKCFFLRRKSNDTLIKKNVIIIVFRGSDDLTDWWDNINFLACKGSKEGLHSGFANRYGHFEYAIRKLLLKHMPDEIWVTGHSLGGALAVICAEQIESDAELKSEFGEKLKGVFTFAQPMVSAKGTFNENCKRELEALHVHFVNDNDIVPRLAPTYSHSGLMVRFKGDEDIFITPSYLKEVNLGEYRKESRDGQSSKVSKIVRGVAATYESLKARGELEENFEYGLPFKDDHSIVEYVEKIQGVLVRISSDAKPDSVERGGENE